MGVSRLLTFAHFRFFVSFINYCLSINYKIPDKIPDSPSKTVKDSRA